MAIHVEFYGIARQRIGASDVSLDPVDGQITLGTMLIGLAEKFPGAAGELFCGDRLHTSLVANLDGTRFISDPATVIRDGTRVLILSADAGG